MFDRISIDLECIWLALGWIGGGSEVDLGCIPGGLEDDWRRIGGGLEEDRRRIGGAGMFVPSYVELFFSATLEFVHEYTVNIAFETREGCS